MEGQYNLRSPGSCHILLTFTALLCSSLFDFSAAVNTELHRAAGVKAVLVRLRQLISNRIDRHRGLNFKHMLHSQI